MTGTSEDKMREAIIAQASAWQARHLSGELTAAEKVEFLKWLQDNPHNVREYLLNSQIAKLMPQALAGSSGNPEAKDSGDGKIVRLNPSFVARSAQRPDKLPLLRFLRRATAAILVCAVTYFGVQYYASRDVLQVAVAHGDQRTLQLSDGSTVHLNSESKARVRYSEQERLIELERGQAMFKVARDPARPFRVRAGHAEVLAVGTQFDVYRRKAGGITVTVVEGRVAVLDARAAAGSEGKNKHHSVELVNLTAGERIDLGTAAESQKAGPVSLSDATAWTRRQIVFKGQPLGEVADEFNRYLSVPVHIEDEGLRNIHVSGIFSAYDQEGFVAFLKEFDGVKIDVGREVIQVTRERQGHSH